MSFFSQVLAVARKDIISELRTREIISSVLVFAILVLVIFNFAFEPDQALLSEIAPGIIWVAFVFSGILALNRTFIPEKEEQCLEGLMICPVDRETIYLGKAIGSLFFLLMVEAIMLLAFALLFNVAVFQLEMIVIVLLTSLGFVVVGTLFSALAVNTRAREMVLPVMFLPIITPVIIAAVKASALVFAGKSWSDIVNWVIMLVAFDVIFIVVSYIVFPYVIEE
ncbi:MAG: heme exporter protein CcmB [Dehalococcoidia bacterium]|nr:heme exporter protein CcmB [Dehalococcoidia bacterium]